MFGTLHKDLSTSYWHLWQKFIIKALLHNTQCFILLTVTWGLTIMRRHSCNSNATMVRRRRHNVTLYVHCLYGVLFNDTVDYW